MPRTKISEFSATAASNTDIDSINIAEGCAPSGINDAIRELMAQLKDFQTGAVGDSFNGPVGSTTAAAGAFTTLSASSTVSGTGFSTYLASPPAIGGTAAAAGSFTTLAASSTLGVTGVSTLTGGAVVQGLTVGRGAGAVSTNTAVGYQAINATASGDSNNAFGYQALNAVTSGSQNTALGRAALISNTTGSHNIGVGGSTLYGNTTGSYNTAVGREALQSNTTASNNTAVGYQAGYSGNPSENTSVGSFAGYTSNGGYNVFVGKDAGKLSSGSGNCFVGWSAGFNSTGSNNTFVGANGTTTSGYLMTTGSKNTILGAYSGNNGGLDIRTSSGYVVLSDGDGNPVYKTQNNATWALQGAGVVGGTGISFPATQSASSDANTLDDYEEGTWTPTPNSGSFSSPTGNYVKVGRLVTITFDFTVATGGGSTMTAPFTSNSTNASGIYTSGQTYGVGTTSPTIIIGGSTTTLYFRTVGSAVAFNGMALTAGASISGTLSYYASA
jgi:hypothetical protein